jgi:multidrug efflux system outer membrane protein
MRSTLRLGTWLLCLGLAGCKLGPDYERPEIVLPEDYRLTLAEGASFANLDWWQLFEDPVLEELIEIALRNNQNLLIATARIGEARALLGFTRADLYPTLNGAAQAGRGNFLAGVPGTTTDVYLLSANLDYEIDLWGRVRRANEAARAELLAGMEARKAVTIALVADVASAYLLLLDLDQRVDIARRTVDSRTDSLGIIQARYDKGTVALIDVNQAEIQLYEAEARLAALERDRAQAENLLSVLLGQPPGPIERGAVPLQASLAIPEIPAGLPSELLERRPDVRQAEQSLAAQTARIGAARALRFPTFRLTGLFGLASTELDGFVSSDNEAWNLQGSLLGPLIDWGRARSRQEAEEARAEQALHAYQLTVLLALQEVDNALVNVQTLGAEARAREAQEASARSAVTLSRARYDGGVTSFLEVLESERSLFDAQLQASAIRRAQIVSIVTLYKALGGGWPTDEEIENARGYENATLRPGSRSPPESP